VVYVNSSRYHWSTKMMFKQVLSSGMNGVELVRQIREKDKNIKVVLMSAYDPTSIEGSKEYELSKSQYV
jgi:two-component SAPR family response regulator